MCQLNDLMLMCTFSTVRAAVGCDEAAKLARCVLMLRNNPTMDINPKL